MGWGCLPYLTTFSPQGRFAKRPPSRGRKPLLETLTNVAFAERTFDECVKLAAHKAQSTGGVGKNKVRELASHRVGKLSNAKIAAVNRHVIENVMGFPCLDGAQLSAQCSLQLSNVHPSSCAESMSAAPPDPPEHPGGAVLPALPTIRDSL